VLCLVRLEDKQETLLIGRNEGPKAGNLLQRVVLVEIRELERSDQGSKSFRGESAVSAIVKWIRTSMASSRYM
jgi:hypothetical protein